MAPRAVIRLAGQNLRVSSNKFAASSVIVSPPVSLTFLSGVAFQDGNWVFQPGRVVHPGHSVKEGVPKSLKISIKLPISLDAANSGLPMSISARIVPAAHTSMGKL